MSELVKSLRGKEQAKKRVDYSKHEAPPPQPPLGYYEGGMVLLDFRFEVEKPFICRMFVIDPLTPLELLASHDLQGISDPIILEQHLYPVARAAGCLKKHYSTQPFPMFYLTKETHRIAWFAKEQPATREPNGKVQFRRKVKREYPPFTISDQTRLELAQLMESLSAQAQYYQEMDSTWFFV